MSEPSPTPRSFRLTWAQAWLNPPGLMLYRLAGATVLVVLAVLGAQHPAVWQIWLTWTLLAVFTWLSGFSQLRDWSGEQTVALDEAHLFHTAPRRPPSGPIPLVWVRAGRGFAGAVVLRLQSGHAILVPRTVFEDLRIGPTLAEAHERLRRAKRT